MSEYSVLTTDVVIPDANATDAPDYACKVCGLPLTYAGRGRKPEYCDEHRKGARKSSDKVGKPNATNLRLAEQAADVLRQYNDMLAGGLYVGGMRETASDLAAKNDAFRDQVCRALVTDPALCRSIINAGQKSARGSLIFAYLVLGFGIAPTAVTEFKARREAKKVDEIPDE